MQANALLKVSDAVFTVAAVVALVISRFDPEKRLFWVGIGLAVIAAVGGFLLRNAAKERRKEVVIDVDPLDWTVKRENGMAMRAWLDIPQERHGKGADINVRIVQVETQHFDFDEPSIKDGNITIRYSRNNFPINPRIALKLHVSGRG